MSLAPEGLVLPATMVSVRVAVPYIGQAAAVVAAGGVAADGAGGQGGRAVVVQAAAV